MTESRNPGPVRSGRIKPSRLIAALCIVVSLSACGQSPDDMLASAKDYLARNDINAASIQLKNALQKDGTIAEARFLLGSVYLQQGDIPASVRELRRASELGYPAVEVLPLLSRAMVLAGDFDRVVADFAGVELDDPAAQARILGNLGDARIGRQEVELAREAYEAALAISPDDVDARVGLARTRLFGGELEEALADTDAVIAAQAGHAEAHALRASVLLALERNDEVVPALEAAVAAEPRGVNYHYALVSTLLQQERLDEAETRLEAMKRVAANDPSTRYLEAFVEYRKGNLTAARDAVEAVLRTIPNHLLADLLAGNIHLQLGDHVRARQHLERVVSLAPGHPLARRLLAASLLATGDAARAREVLEPMLAADAEDPATLNLAGQVFLASGDFDRASDFFARVAAVSPDDVRARTSLGIARLAGGDPEAAFADLEAASALDDSAAQPDIALVLAHLRAGELDKALAAQEQMARKLPDHPQTHNLLGGIMIAKADLAAARAAFDRALELDPDFLSAAVNLARIDINQGRMDEALKRFEAMIARNPARPDPYLLLAELQRQTGASQAEVRATLERAIEATRGARPARLALLRDLILNNESTRALTLAQELVAAQENDPAALGMLAQAQVAVGDQQQAISTLNRLVRLQPQAPAPLMVLAEVQRAVNDRAGAEQSLRRALSLRPDWLEAQQRLVAVLAELGKSSEAIAVLRDMQRQRPAAVLGHALEGDLQVALGNWDAAVAPYEAAMARGATADLAVKLHRAQTRSGKDAEAAATAKSWLDANPDDVLMRAYLAELALARGQHAEAETLYRRVIEIQPDNPLILNNLAWVAGELGRDDALALAERAIARAPDSPAVLDTLGMLQVAAGRHEEGLANQRKAVDGAPEQPLLRLNLARTLITLERKADAARELEEVIRLAPEGSALSQEAIRLKEAL